MDWIGVKVHLEKALGEKFDEEPTLVQKEVKNLTAFEERIAVRRVEPLNRSRSPLIKPSTKPGRILIRSHVKAGSLKPLSYYREANRPTGKQVH